MRHGNKQHVWSACYRQRVPYHPHNSSYRTEKMCSEYLPMGAMIAPYGCFDVSSVLLTSNDEVVALLVCTILMVGSILKSAAAQIELGELITTCGNILVSIKNGRRNKWHDMHRWLLLRPAYRIKLQTSGDLSIRSTYQGFRPGFQAGPRAPTRKSRAS